MAEVQSVTTESTAAIGEAPVGNPGLVEAFWRRLGLNQRHRRYFLNALWLALVIRLAVFGIGYLAMRILSKNADPLWPMFYQAFSRWDANNFYILAEEGYTFGGPHQGLLAFFPLFPWMLRALGFVTQNFFTPGLLISFASSVVAGYYLQALVALDHDDETAHWALKYFFLFPTAYFLCLPYTEALFLALTLGSWYEARRGRWAIAGLAGLLSGLTRMQGLVLFPALLIEAWTQRRQTPWPRLLWILLVPMGFGLYLLLNWKVAGSPFAFTILQKSYFGNKMVAPWEPIQGSLAYLSGKAITEQGTSIELMRLLTVCLTSATLLLGVRRIRLSYQFYAWAQFVMAMLSSWLMSLPRYVLCLFPLYIIYAGLSRNPEFHFRLLSFSMMIMACLTVFFAHGFWAY